MVSAAARSVVEGVKSTLTYMVGATKQQESEESNEEE